MAVVVNLTHTFGGLSSPVPLSYLDADYTDIVDALGSLNTFSNYYVDTGAKNAYAFSLPSGITASLTAGLMVQVKIANTNDAASTLNVGATGVKNIYLNGAALVGGELVSGNIYTFIYDGTQYQLSGTASSSIPTRQVFKSGSGTYTTPAGVTRINIRMAGAGGGGGGAANAGGGTGGTGGSTTFSTFTAAGGVGGTGGAAGSVGAGGAGGAASGSPDIGLSGGSGWSPYGAGAAVNGPGGGGGATAFGGAGNPVSTTNGGAGKTNTGAGGAGGGSSAGSAFFPAGGGGAGAYIETAITTPSATYSYAVGAAGTAGTGSFTGGAGGSGIIIVDEYYN
jgi:hypothetical protein